MCNIKQEPHLKKKGKKKAAAYWGLQEHCKSDTDIVIDLI